jgi:hypothetical protein
MLWIALLGGAGLLLLVVEHYKTSAMAGIALPAILPSTGAGGIGETAAQQEAQSGEQEGIAIAAGAAQGAAVGGPAGAAVGAGVAAVNGLLQQLTQHSARLAAAKAENTAIPPAVQAFDADLAAIAQAYSSGKATPAQVSQAILALNFNMYSNLHGLVGKPGTAWLASGVVPTPNSLQGEGPGVICNTACTAACCLFYDDLAPPLVTIWQVMNGIKPGNYYAPIQGGFVITVPKVYPPDDPAYGSFTRPLYQLTFLQPATTPVSLLGSVI